MIDFNNSDPLILCLILLDSCAGYVLGQGA